MTNQSTDKKPLPRARGTTKGVEKLRQKYPVVHNIPEGSELAIDTTTFVTLFKSEIQAKLFKKRSEDK
jgi:hypothetical protein